MNSSQGMNDAGIDRKRFRAVIDKIFNRPDIWSVMYIFIMIIPNILLDITESMNVWGKIANIIVPLSLYTLFISRVKRPGVLILSLVIMMIMNSFQIVLFYLYGESIIAIDMLINCVTSNPAEASELLSNLTFPIIVCACIYVPMIVWAIYSLRVKPSLRTSERFRARFSRYGLLGLAGGIVISVIATFDGPKYSVSRDLYPFNVISNIGSALSRIYESINYDKTSANFTYNANYTRDSNDDEVVVLILGETSRAGNWQLFGYDRETNPMLSQRNDLIKFPRAVTQSNTTHKCVPLMLTPIDVAHFDSIKYYKSAVTAFNEAGYKTAFYSNQAKNHSFTQFFSEEADDVDYLDGDRRYDHYLVEELKQALSDSVKGRQFIILHTYGSHFNYRDRYDDKFSYFKPDDSTSANVKHRPVLMNAYDNSLRYIDNYLNDAIEYLDSLDIRASLIFSSDHGEDIFDDDRGRFLHASPVATYYQLHVPMFAWFSDEYHEEYPEIVANIQSNASKYNAPSQALFHTLMDIGGIKTKYYDSTNSLASEEFISPVPVYLNDYNEAVPLEESGLKPQDIEKLNALGIFGAQR